MKAKTYTLKSRRLCKINPIQFLILSSCFCIVPVNNNSCLKALYNNSPPIKKSVISMHVAKVGRKTSILTGRGHWQKQGQGEGTMYWRIGEERRETNASEVSGEEMPSVSWEA